MSSASSLPASELPDQTDELRRRPLGTRKILETLNYLLPSNPFSSTLDDRLSPISPSASPESTSYSRLVFHPQSLAPTESKSTSKVYEEARELVESFRGEATTQQEWKRFMNKVLLDTEVK